MRAPLNPAFDYHFNHQPPTLNAKPSNPSLEPSTRKQAEPDMWGSIRKAHSASVTASVGTARKLIILVFGTNSSTFGE